MNLIPDDVFNQEAPSQTKYEFDHRCDMMMEFLHYYCRETGD